MLVRAERLREVIERILDRLNHVGHIVFVPWMVVDLDRNVLIATGWIRTGGPRRQPSKPVGDLVRLGHSSRAVFAGAAAPLPNATGPRHLSRHTSYRPDKIENMSRIRPSVW